MVSENYRVSPFEAWRIGIALRLHFAEGGYDALKFNFKVPQTQRSFETRRDRYFYEKVAKSYPKKQACIEFFLANMLAGKTWIGDMTGEIYALWQNRMQSLSYSFKSELSDCKQYCDQRGLSFDDLFSYAGELPPIYKLYFSQKVSLETLCALDVLCNYCAHINKNVSDPMGILQETSRIVVGYKPFLLPKIDKQKYKEIAFNAFTNL
jgi:hypothetical protein